jgi:adenosylcobinamide-GDP ribazoletransferase
VTPIRQHWRAFHAAVTFLTRLPWPWVTSAPPDGDDLARSTTYFPLVGALIGAVGAGVNWLAAHIWPAPPPLAITITIAAIVLLTGALHEDGLADTADGLGGGRDRDHALAIMKDSRIGTYGAVALILTITAKITALSTLAPFDVARALIAAHTLARWSSLPFLRWLPYARPTGTGAPYATPRLIAGSFITLAIVVPLLGTRALAPIITTVMITTLAGWYFSRRLAGITGDCLGAANQLVELTTYLVLAAT